MSVGKPMHAVAPYQDSVEQGRMILRDGSTATIRISSPADCRAVREFYRRLSPSSRRFRFFSETKPGEDVIDPLCDSSSPRKQLTLLVFRHADEGPRIIATGSYIAMNETTAEFAVAVDDTFQGRGLGGLLLERLSVLAVAQGFEKFQAVVDPANQGMLDTFRNSGFAIREKFDEECFHFDIDVSPRAESVARAEMRDRLFTKASIDPFFHPRSVAVVGASRDPQSFGHRIMESLVASQFKGNLYPVNPQAGMICSTKAYPRIAEIPGEVDLAIIVLPKENVLDAVDKCAERGVRAVIVISAGFAELDEAGARLQQELVQKVRGHGMRLVGPNCLGLINTDPAVRLNASFSSAYPPHGRVALSSQSGALGLAILSLARQRNLGLSMFISMGNKADVTGNDLLLFWEDDAGTDVILLYLESFGNPRRFARIARRVSRRKPIVCVKSGRHRKLSDAAVSALFRQSGVIRANTIEEMFDVAALLGNQPLPRGRRVGIVTNSRGAGVLCLDTCEAVGLEIGGVSAATAAKLKALLPEGSSVGPMIDLSRTATASHYRHAIEHTLLDPQIDALIVLHIPIGAAGENTVSDSFAQAVSVARARGTADKPVLAVMLTGDGQPGLLDTGREKIPHYLFPEAAARTLAVAADYAAWKSGPQGDVFSFEDVNAGAARGLCCAFLANKISAVIDGAAAIEVLSLFGVSLSPDADSDALLALDVTEDATFGPLISLTIEGHRHDADNIRTTPLTDRDAAEMVAQLQGEDGAPPDGLGELLQRVSLMVEEIPEISALEIRGLSNDGGWRAVKIQLRLAPPRRDQPQRVVLATA